MRHLCALAMLLVAGPLPARPAEAPERVDIALKSFGYTPATLTLHHGRPYVLHLTNTASGGHDFTAKSFFAAATVDPADRKLVAKGGVELDGDASADVRLVAPAPGRYPVHCSHFMHTAFGMKGVIVVD